MNRFFMSVDVVVVCGASSVMLMFGCGLFLLLINLSISLSMIC